MTAGGSLLDAVRWEEVAVGAGVAAGSTQLRIGRAGASGPVALITAGIHGDEGPWGAWAISRLLAATPASDLKGSLRLVPVTNPLAMEIDARCAPLDSLDLNRVFPGNRGGSHTERLAAALVEHAVEGADYLIDLHGGGSWCVNAFVFRSSAWPEGADAFGAPFTVDMDQRAAVTRGLGISGYAKQRGAKPVSVEFGGRSPAEGDWAERIALGMRRALIAAGVLKPDPALPVPADSIAVKPSHVIRPGQGGILLPAIDHSHVGTVVAEGTLLGRLVHPASFETLEEFRAPYPRTALLLIRPTLTLLEAGAMTYVVSEPE